jgi:hypothetical protein
MVNAKLVAVMMDTATMFAAILFTSVMISATAVVGNDNNNDGYSSTLNPKPH